MGLIEQEIIELRELAKGVQAGTVPLDKASTLVGIYNQTSKRVGQMIQINALAQKEGKNSKTYQRFSATNIIGDGSAIQIEGQSVQMVKCPEAGGKIITRGECLDYSGVSHHIDACQLCEQFVITRKQMQ